MRRSTPTRIGDLWSGFIESNPTRMRRFCEARIPELWPEVAGAAASFTTALDIRNGMLYVSIRSSVVRHELFMRRAELQQELNRRLGMNVVAGIIVK
ncbi:MAG TPA: DUF721 domain-containing protein [Candidatus Tidjanibacter faecipullorum]|uniref:DUF721 domain-containing protein n=1 Tax=Candidatus Tidjanibacter faecipullorum TaxID=2838766 RepID=A0A9D2DEK9_9BACT|nr:DUF721 domain-containing protein [Candidatus Tidjanibacter faecipullorum]